MKQLRQPVRKRVPQRLEYTFKDGGAAIIALDAYLTANLDVKLNGQLYDTMSASFVAPRSSGKVEKAVYVFDEAGVWQVQFWCETTEGSPLFGEPIEILVVENVEDLSLDELLKY